MSEQQNKQVNPMFKAGDPELVAKERRELQELKHKGMGARFKWYFSKSGPGWMQSAMTLGGGSAMAALFSGAFLQYKLLWVQPVAMLIGIACMAALAYQTLTTQQRPFEAMKKFVSPVVAWAWAICTIVATIIWHFPQYSLVSGMSLDLIEAFSGHKFAEGSWSQTIVLLLLGCFILFLASRVVWNYGKGGQGIKIFEKIVKSIVWFIIAAFLVVVVVCSINGSISWGAVGRGFLPFSFDGGFHFNLPGDGTGVTIFIASLSAAIGINMTFLFGYTFLAKGWTKEYAGLQRFDMFTGMLIPYTIATSLMIIAAGATIHTPEFVASGATNISPIKAAGMLEAAGLPALVSRLIFGLGIIGMCFNAITMHMLVSGFAVCEMFKIEASGWKYKLATLLPAPGLLGVLFWSKIGTWIAIPTSAIALTMLPVAYIGFFCLNNSVKYLGKDMPRGRVRFWWNLAMIIAISIVVVSAVYFVITKLF
ncbi:MAG: divalent metal cation transporter [Bacteroidales bacterium]|nr:divalent metal cation transporter [Bacteroidales bacterium]MCL2133706.1 divalent metal cation transporter [Bacteroidales bacterium]